ncbi:MAG: iron-containing alcohol dehydrogenase [Bacteroidales bacterium]
MENFIFQNPVKIIFGKDTISKIQKEIPQDARVLMIYGGGSIKRNGVYDAVQKALTNHKLFEFGGIEPNPEFSTCMKAVELIKQENIDFLLAVGGGSVLDATKFISASSKFEGDPYDILEKRSPIRKALPLGTVITLPATGSEMNSGGVITRAEFQTKLVFGSPLLFPKFSVLNPETTYSLPKHQVANGVVDAFVHVMEQYLTYSTNAPVQDRFAESLLLTLIEEGPKNITAGEVNYDARANLMWAATMALNGLISSGVQSDWATHLIGHELTAFHGLDHAVTLAIVLPELLRKTKNKRKEKLLQFGSRVWNINHGTEEERMELTISKTEDFFHSLGIKTKLSEYNISPDTIDRIVERFDSRGMKAIGGLQDISLVDLKDILNACI